MDGFDYILEAASEEKHFKLGPLDVESFVKANAVKEVSDPMFFIKDGVPTINGLLSNEIFGITKEERANTFAYIDLHGWFMHPLVYKMWGRMDHRVKDIVHGTKKFIINEHGDFEENENGQNGVDFIRKNIDKIHIRSTESRRRDNKIQYIEKFKKYIFMRKYIVIPAYYRDVQYRSGNMSVGNLNKYYSSLLIASRSLQETEDYGIHMTGAIHGRIQETIVKIYDCLCGTSSDPSDGTGLSKKKGLVRNTVMSKTADYGTRLVLTAPQLKGETLDDLMVDMDYSALPLASACVNFYPYIIYWCKRFFENEFGAGDRHQIITKDGKVNYAEVKNPLETFSDDNIKAQIKRFIWGYSGRFSPVEVPLSNGKMSYMIFKGHNVSGIDVANREAVDASPLITRKMTWCDVLYMAANEAVRDKHILISRYPIDSPYNQLITKARISTIADMEPVYVNGTYYRWYPKIREKDVGTNTSRLFIDSMQISNVFLKAMGGDYDGDQVGVRGVYTVEANEELDDYCKSKMFLINLSGSSKRISTNEAIQSIYSLTKVMSEDKTKLTNPTY